MAYPYDDDPEQQALASYLMAQGRPDQMSMTGREAGTMAGSMVPGTGLMDALGIYPAGDQGFNPSVRQNLGKGEYLDAMFQLLGAGGDVAMATGVGVPVGMTMKTAAAAGKGAKAASKAGKAPRMSAAEAEAAGYYHPVGAKKLPVPISEMKVDRIPAGSLADWKKMSAEKMQGAAVMPLSGDRSIAGQLLRGIGDTQFIDPVYLEGGYDFMRANPNAVWAMGKGDGTKLQKKIDNAAEQYGDVYGAFAAMAHHPSMNFNTMMSDALLEQVKAGKITKKSIGAFDKEMKSVRPEWKGLMHPESREMLESNGALRHAFVNRMQMDEFQNAGFPNIDYTRFALTDPKLMDEPTYSSGLAIGKMSPGSSVITSPMTPHKTYPNQLAGQYVGGFEQSVPMQVMYPDYFKKRRAEGRPVSGDVYSFYRGAPVQPTNQEWLDGLMNYLERPEALGY